MTAVCLHGGIQTNMIPAMKIQKIIAVALLVLPVVAWGNDEEPVKSVGAPSIICPEQGRKLEEAINKYSSDKKLNINQVNEALDVFGLLAYRLFACLQYAEFVGLILADEIGITPEIYKQIAGPEEKIIQAWLPK